MTHGMTKVQTYGYGEQQMDSSLLQELRQRLGREVDGSKEMSFVRRKRLWGGGPLRRGHVATCRQRAVEELGMARAWHTQRAATSDTEAWT